MLEEKIQQHDMYVVGSFQFVTLILIL